MSTDYISVHCQRDSHEHCWTGGCYCWCHNTGEGNEVAEVTGPVVRLPEETKVAEQVLTVPVTPEFRFEVMQWVAKDVTWSHPLRLIEHTATILAFLETGQTEEKP